MLVFYLLGEVVLEILVQEMACLAAGRNERNGLVQRHEAFIEQAVQQNIRHVIVERRFFILELGIDPLLVEHDDQDVAIGLAQLRQEALPGDGRLVMAMQGAHVLEFALKGAMDAFSDFF